MREFQWGKEVAKLMPDQIADLAVSRGYRPNVVEWLSEQGWIGWSDFGGGRYCFPVHDGGRIVAAHQIPPKKGKPITYFPKGKGVHPLIVGNLAKDSPVFVFESQWDLIAALDAADYPKNPVGAYIATRGAANRISDSLPIPDGKPIYAVIQNDETKHGRNAAEDWLSKQQEQNRWPIYRVELSKEYEDPQAMLYHVGLDAFAAEMREAFERANIAVQGSKPETETKTNHPFIIAAEQLAAMPPHESDQLRKGVAKEHGVTLSTLDATVSEIRKKAQPDTMQSIVEELSPWPENVNLPDLLKEIVTTVSRHVCLPEGAATAISLWIAGAYAYEPSRIFPKLFITSPEKRCGKTTLLEVIEALSPRALVASNITPAAMFRVIEMSKPTLIIDEADTFLANNDELNGIINSGHTKKGASVIRTVGDDHTPKKFSTWCPQVIAGIGKQKDTLIDRSVTIRLRRMANGERAERIPFDLSERKLDLRRKLLKWAEGNSVTVANASPEMPPCPNGRAEDNWRPLIGIADLAEGIWPERARKAFITFNSESEEGDEETMRIQVLRDIQTIFDQAEEKEMWSESLIEKLVEMEDRPWSEYKGGFKPITAHSLSRLLKPFEIKSVQIWESGSNRRGYRMEQFADAFARYLY